MNFRTIQFCLALILTISAVNAGAQKVSITSGGFPSVSGHAPGTPVSTQRALGQTIAAGLVFGDVSPNGISSRRVVIKLPVRISAKRTYKVELQRIAFNDTSIQPSDIGFGIGNVRPQNFGSDKLTATATNINILGNFGTNPVTALLVNGTPRYQSSLADIFTTPTPIFTGGRTVKRGILGEDGNSILVDLTFVITPQYYTPTDLSNLRVTIMITQLTQGDDDEDDDDDDDDKKIGRVTPLF